MKKYKLNIKLNHFLNFFLLSIFSVRAQDFNYQLNTSSTEFSDIYNPNYITQNENWKPSYKIPIGFSFNYLGKLFDSVEVFLNGSVVFDKKFNYCFSLSSINSSPKIDSSGNNLSSVSYSIDGSVGRKIFKVQFKNFGLIQNNSSLINYQLWLYEGSNKVDLHIGSSINVENIKPKIGLINLNPLNSKQLGSYASSLNKIYGTANPALLNNVPITNTLYQFTPNF